MYQRMQDLAVREDLPDLASQALAKTLGVHERLSDRRARVEGWLAAADDLSQRRQTLVGAAQAMDTFLVQMDGYPEWRAGADRLHADGAAILTDPDWRCTSTRSRSGGRACSGRWTVSADSVPGEGEAAAEAAPAVEPDTPGRRRERRCRSTNRHRCEGRPRA